MTATRQGLSLVPVDAVAMDIAAMYHGQGIGTFFLSFLLFNFVPSRREPTLTSRGDHAQNKGEPHGATYPCCRQEGHQGRARGHAYPPGPACPRSTVRSPLAVFPPKLNGLGTSVSVHCLVCSLCSLSPPRHRLAMLSHEMCRVSSLIPAASSKPWTVPWSTEHASLPC